MSKIKNNRTGFVGVEALLILLVLVLIGVVGWMVYNNHKTVKTAATTSTTAAAQKTATAADPYSGWKQYCSSHEKSCFKYPSSWTFQDNCSSECSDIDNVDVSSAGGTDISFTSSIAGVGGYCDPATTPHVIYTKVEPLASVSGLYLVESTRADVTDTTVGLKDATDGQVPKTGDTGRCLDYLSFTAKNTPNASAWLQGKVPDSAKASDLTTAELVLKSYAYQ